MNQSNENNSGKEGGRGILLFLSLFIAIWGVFGWLDVPKQSQNGLKIDRDNRVSHVLENRPAWRAGMQVGDLVTSIEGIKMDDAAGLARLPRVEVDERRHFYVTRGEINYEYTVTYREPTMKMKSRGWARIIVGFAFLLIPLFAYLGAPNRATKVLVLVGMGLGLSFMGGPYFHQFDIRALFTMVETLFVYTGLAAMLHFLLIFPHVRPLMQRTYARKLIYWPALLLWVLLTWNLFFTPPVSSPMTVVVNLATGLIIGLYLLFCLITLLRNFSRTTREERKKLGFNRMMIGTIAALLPVLVANTVSAVSPDLPLPWQEYYFVFLVLIPATWATAAQKLGNG